MHESSQAILKTVPNARMPIKRIYHREKSIILLSITIAMNWKYLPLDRLPKRWRPLVGASYRSTNDKKASWFSFCVGMDLPFALAHLMSTSFFASKQNYNATLGKHGLFSVFFFCAPIFDGMYSLLVTILQEFHLLPHLNGINSKLNGSKSRNKAEILSVVQYEDSMLWQSCEQQNTISSCAHHRTDKFDWFLCIASNQHPRKILQSAPILLSF